MYLHVHFIIAVAKALHFATAIRAIHGTPLTRCL